MRRALARPYRSRHGFSALELAGVMGVIAMVAGFLFAWGAHATERARDSSCRSNLKQMGLALAMYADDYGGRLPGSKDAIFTISSVYTKNQQLLVCPADREPRKVRRDGADYEVSYFIVPGYATDDPPSTIVAGDTAARHGHRWNAVCLDGRLKVLPARDLASYAQYVIEGKSDDETQPQGVHAD